MNILAIDCACSNLSVAVNRGITPRQTQYDSRLRREKVYSAEIDSAMKQSEMVMDCIETVMSEATLKPVDLNVILCMRGPGSFTGLRIGYSISKGLALSLSVPFIPVPTLECIALAANLIHGSAETYESKSQFITLSVIEARKNAFFYAFFRLGDEGALPARLTQDKDGDAGQITDDIKLLDTMFPALLIKKIIITGPGSVLLCKSLPSDLTEKIITNNERRGYAKDLISFARIKYKLDNTNTPPEFSLYEPYLHSGPEYNRTPF